MCPFLLFRERFHSRQRLIPRFRFFWCLLFVLSALAVATAVFAQQCTPTTQDPLSRFSNKPRDANGAIHITIDYSAGLNAPDPIVKQAMEAAVNEWNSFSGTTNVVRISRSDPTGRPFVRMDLKCHAIGSMCEL